MKVAVPLVKYIFAPLGITAAASEIDARIQKKIYGSGTTTLIILNEEMARCKLIKLLKILIFYWKELIKQIKQKEQKEVFLGMLLGTLGASLLGNISTG